jgi:transketolase
MSEIKYTADANAFPPLKNSNDTKSTAAETQADLTHVSAITDSVINTAVKEAFDVLQREHKAMEKQWQAKFDTLQSKMNELSKSVATDVIAAMLHSDQMPFLNKTDFFTQMTSQTTAMTAIMEASNTQVQEIKTMFTTIEATLRDGPPIKSPPRKLRQNRDIHTDVIIQPPSSEAAGDHQ